jgi:hypothetical protein
MVYSCKEGAALGELGRRGSATKEMRTPGEADVSSKKSLGKDNSLILGGFIFLAP